MALKQVGLQFDITEDIEYRINNMSIRLDNAVENARNATKYAFLAHLYATYIHEHQEQYLGVQFPNMNESGYCEVTGYVTEDVIDGIYKIPVHGGEEGETIDESIKDDLVDNYFDSQLHTIPSRIWKRAVIFVENSFTKLGILREVDTIGQSTICGVMTMKNGDPLDLILEDASDPYSSLECTIRNKSGLFTITILDEEGNEQQQEEDFSDMKTFRVDTNNHTFSVTGYYGPKDDSSSIQFNINRRYSYYHDPDRDDDYYGETVTESFNTTYELLVYDINPPCIDPFEIN